ncbi:MAG: translation initiation factor [Odoribacteraceae bacterium]|jgi:translation initiation factor 1|nr:translation initiation factor [Odoribacteraceae bacterium]
MTNHNHEKESDGRLVYSTNPGSRPERDNNEPHASASGRQVLRVFLDSHRRKGKTVTIVSGFTGPADGLKELASALKNKCGAGGSVKDGEIIIQGDFRDKILALLRDSGYRAG